ncbi:MAG: sigma-70 family RNA polymerase sigma factor [Pseudonocardia sp.]|nr:sigma-70 family RNA polymerase sigma factor [Pseudonocardia sp.]
MSADERDRAIAALFAEHRTPMVRLAALLGADDPEDIVAEAFYQLFRRWRRLRDPDAAVSYLRAVVCNLTRMRLRHLLVARRHLAQRAADPTTANQSPTEALPEDQRVLLEALKTLPARQRQALVLRYWLDLREAQIAEAMGISTGAVKTHTSRGMAALTRVLEQDETEQEQHRAVGKAHAKTPQEAGSPRRGGQYSESVPRDITRVANRGARGR